MTVIGAHQAPSDSIGAARRNAQATCVLALAATIVPSMAFAQDFMKVHYGRRLVNETYAFIGPEVANPEMRFAGNNLACQNCHLDGGRISHGLSLVGVSDKYPKSLDDGTEESLAERVNGCMTRSMNGKPLPEDGAEMAAFIAYLDMLTADAGSYGNPAEVPEPLPAAASRPDPERGAGLYANLCAACHAEDGRGMRNGAPGQALGYLHPPLWGPDSFNAGAGMHEVATAAAFIHDNMPLGTSFHAPVLTPQDAWDIAAFIETQPRPPNPEADH